MRCLLKRDRQGCSSKYQYQELCIQDIDELLELYIYVANITTRCKKLLTVCEEVTPTRYELSISGSV